MTIIQCNIPAHFPKSAQYMRSRLLKRKRKVLRRIIDWQLDSPRLLITTAIVFI